ncbi:Tubulin-folding cofactor [Vigna angularis]|uniref:Tubulin-folding cofactor n=3 Tax=Phaseolus angularis TaxID=3914 RepID=A0A8T0LEP9_PHAAN|nr:uncharacterized protein LOC108346826 isoform X1 [Vigna angularis]KAG2410749.1 Tubulin-folding cofactor [Vigna angularis]
MASGIQLHGEDSVVLRVTHSNLKTFNTDIRFSLQLTVEGVKDKLWKKCGTSVNSMHLELYEDARNDKIADLSDNSKPLGFYSPLDGFRLHVVDLDPTSISSGGWLEDTSLVEKYQISEEAYNKRQDTFRKYKEKITSHVPATAEAKMSDTSEEELCANIKKMAPSPPPPPPTNHEVPGLVRMMESFVVALQQQNTSLVQLNTIAMQQLEAARVSAETSQRYVDLMSSGRTVTRPSSSSPAPAQEWSLESFLQHHPAKFHGKVSLDEADQWFKDIERIFNAKRCPDENRLVYAEYLLSGEAGYWWSNMRMLLDRSGTPITWGLFKKKFYSEYFPDSVRFAKEMEFLQLVQGGMSVSEYADKFKHLIRFHTMERDEEWQCRKFENGLRGDIKLLVAGLYIKKFPSLVDKARVLEKTKNEVESQQRQPPRVGGPSGSRFSQGDRRKPYSRPPSHWSRGSSSQPVGQVGQSGGVRCYSCGGPHYRNVCPRLSGAMKCYTCGKEGHVAMDCLQLKDQDLSRSGRVHLSRGKVADLRLQTGFMLCQGQRQQGQVGSRCEVEPGAKRGVVKFVGRAESLGPGLWVGVQYDEPLGKHDGMVKGVRYFECPPSHGGIVRPDKVKVGDYPERDPFEEDEI